MANRTNASLQKIHHEDSHSQSDLTNDADANQGTPVSDKKGKKMGTFKKWISDRLGSGSGTGTDEKSANKAIGKKMAGYAKQRSIRMLLLGAGGSGKSTVLKQMHRAYDGSGGGDNVDDEKKYETSIPPHAIQNMHKNIVMDICDLCKQYLIFMKNGIEDIPKFSNSSSELETLATSVAQNFDLVTEPHLSMAFAKDVATLWNTDTLKAVFEVRKKSHVMDNTPYFLDRVVQFAAPDYQVTFDDYVRIRDQTIGVIESKFEVHDGMNRNIKLDIIDVGGQRAERRKWLQVFDGIHLVIFVMSLSAYDQVLFEDHTTRCLDESLSLFQKTVHNKAFKSTDFVVFCNKCDIFEEKIKTVPFTVYNAEWSEDDKHDGDKVTQWIQQQFRDRFVNKSNDFSIKYADNGGGDQEEAKEDIQTSNARTKQRNLHFHITCATDMKQIDKVLTFIIFDSIRNILNKSALI
mmetsp:Transcript_58017/g.96206  ORF Transcript_58017/g.96206 Transcript_58017/m.96206 type:complete len:462 (+) Transcript_58017:22-1407(+)